MISFPLMQVPHISARRNSLDSELGIANAAMEGLVYRVYYNPHDLPLHRALGQEEQECQVPIGSQIRQVLGTLASTRLEELQ